MGKIQKSTEKESTKIDKDYNESVVATSCKITFMASLLSTLVDNLAEGIHKIKCKDCSCFREVSRTIQ